VAASDKEDHQHADSLGWHRSGQDDLSSRGAGCSRQGARAEEVHTEASSGVYREPGDVADRTRGLLRRSLPWPSAAEARTRCPADCCSVREALREVDGTHAVVERVYRVALRGTSPDYALLGEATGTQFRSFVDDLLQLLAWYPNPKLSPRSTDPQNLHLAFRKEILAIVGALVLNAAPASEPNGRNVKFREGLTLRLRVLALLSQREAEWIETASDLWPSALRQRLNSALDQHERSRSRSSPFRSTFFRPGLKYINSFEFRDFTAANEVE
jgi:hypothetical protein